jgi:hypothetical protein
VSIALMATLLASLPWVLVLLAPLAAFLSLMIERHRALQGPRVSVCRLQAQTTGYEELAHAGIQVEFEMEEEREVEYEDPYLNE